MEVFVRDVPEQVTEKGLRNLLQPYMRTLKIEIFHCTKQQQKRFAFLVFLTAEDGNRFLQHYGQQKPSRNAPNGPVFKPKIQILRVTIFCGVSNKPPNPHILRSLEKEQKDRKAKSKTAPSENSKLPARKDFPVLSVSCGVWGYADTDLVFIPYLALHENGQAIFGSRSLLVKLDSGKRIEFLYSCTYGITMQDAPRPSFSVQTWEAPRFYEHESMDLIQSLIASAANLNLNGQRGNKRRRVGSLTPEHAIIAGSCFVYRIELSHDNAPPQSNSNNHIEDDMRALQKVPGLPPIAHQQIDGHRPRKSFASELKALDSTFSASQTLPWKLKFQIRLLVSNGYLTPSQTLAMLPEFQKLHGRSELDICITALQRFRNQILYAGSDTDAKDLELEALVQQLREAEAKAKSDDRLRSTDGPINLSSDHLAMIHRAMITPAGIYLDGPDAEPMNRVLRKYPNHHEFFLRVQFGDEDGEPVRFNPRVSNDLIYNERFKSVLRNGISIAGRRYNFLGFSHSSLRAQSCWFMAPFTHNGSLLFDRMLIQQLGDFTKIRCPAKCAARIGQAFSETPTAVSFPPETFIKINDVERNGRVFSDGVGTLSLAAMRKIWKAVPSMRDTKPTCFQIRFQGAKGMISLDNRLEGERVHLRPSMIKFEGSTSVDIELCGSNARPLPMFLNRQVIKILEDMGVDDHWFLDLQSQEIERLRNITSTAANAAKFLKSQSIGETGSLSWFIKKLTSLGLEFRSDRFLRDVLELSVMMQVRVMKYRARIPVPLGLTLFGVMDETGILEEGQVFCTFTQGKDTTILIGKNLVITRAPALHPGDVQLVEAVNVPDHSPLRWLSNCICFSQKGERDLPSKLSGGDLDGDLYNIVWDSGCKPTHYCHPADYPRQLPQDIGRTVERDDMTDFFIKFMETDQLGRIATSHQVLADQKNMGTSDPDCKLLAELHSTAVDFSKTGIPVDMKLMPKVIPVRPDFMAPGPNIKIHKKEGLLIEKDDNTPIDENDEEDFTPYKYYESTKILGKLFRAIDEHAVFSDLHKYRMTSRDSLEILDQVWDYVVRETRLIQWHQHLSEAQEIREMYEESILSIMKSYSEHPARPISELEAFIGNILGTQGIQSRRQRDLSIPMKEAFDREVASTVRFIRGVTDDYEDLEETLARSIACFSVSLGEVSRAPAGGRKTEPLVSFRYVACAVCLRALDKYLEDD
ncbi:rna-dependent rna polymerase-like protein [Mollisia scopiformis]|uniref:RNA-dependent RNA polymerase n=1 Tax=Mollisia scopiformis TaxID=149040 RepID=A0A194XMC2_MOLSC|nr:rna-dependent rna polymerase-like protein [Mollisia scopiformis]KUJ21239.1 rna-dependent rna polymeras-like protein [Mollisia scopiformis]